MRKDTKATLKQGTHKLLVLDIDDTLAPSGSREIPPRNLAAIRRAQAAGVYVTVATGRGYFGSSYIWRQLGVAGPVINYGGSIIMDTRTDQLLHTSEVPGETVREILDFAAAQGLHAQIYQGDTVIYEKATPYSEAYISKLALPCLVDPDIRAKDWRNVPKVLIYTEEDTALALIPSLQKHYAGRIKVSGTSKGFIEFNQPDATKGNAVAIMAELLGYSREDTITAGDNSLDLEMIQWAGLGCAVGNATPEVLAAADIVLPACEDMAVEYLIDQILLKE